MSWAGYLVILYRQPQWVLLLVNLFNWLIVNNSIKEKRCFSRTEFYSECSGFHFKNKWFCHSNVKHQSEIHRTNLLHILRFNNRHDVVCNLNMRCLPQWQPYNIKEGAINGVKEAVEINFLYFHLGFRIKGTTSSQSQIHYIINSPFKLVNILFRKFPKEKCSISFDCENYFDLLCIYRSKSVTE